MVSEGERKGKTKGERKRRKREREIQTDRQTERQNPKQQFNDLRKRPKGEKRKWGKTKTQKTWFGN